jgi:hypothetical protein
VWHRASQSGKPGGAFSVNMLSLVRDKVYQKYGDKGWYSALRLACLAGVEGQNRQMQLDTMTQSPPRHGVQHLLSLSQFRRLLHELGLRLTPAAFAAFVRQFSTDGSNSSVPFELFVKRLGGGVAGESHALGMPSDGLVSCRFRRLLLRAAVVAWVRPCGAWVFVSRP